MHALDLFHVSPITPSLPAAAGASFIGITGQTVAGTISGLTPHAWTDDATGLFHTATDLHAEWTGYYQQMIAGHAKSLSPIQRLEGNAEAVFEHTGLGKLPAAQQAQIREDVQREIDAIGAAMKIDQQTLGIDPNAPFTVDTYVALSHTIQNNAQLEELAVQGHGLNTAPLGRYGGYTQDAQNNTDNTTRYVGGGVDNNEKAVAAFMDDAIMSHACFPQVWKNGVFIQLNQNGDREQTVAAQVRALDRSMFERVLKATDFKSP
jgi:hypothetical protein